jgi:hypothetical protein
VVGVSPGWCETHALHQLADLPALPCGGLVEGAKEAIDPADHEPALQFDKAEDAE